MHSIQNSAKILLLLFLISSILPSCKTLKSTLTGVKESVANVEKDFSRITDDVDKISNALVPVDTLVLNAVTGALEGVTSEESKKNLDSLTSNLSKNIVKYVNKALDSLDTAAPVEKLVTGLKDSLFAQSTSDDMTQLLNTVFETAGEDLKKIIRGVIATATSEKTKKDLKGLGNAVVSGITDSLGIKINAAISEVNYSVIGDSLASILSKRFEERIVEIAGNASEKITEKAGEGINPTLQFIKDNVMKILGGIGLVAAGLIWLVYHFRQKGKTKESMSSIMMEEIYAAGDHDAIESLKKSIKRKAEKHKVEEQLNKILRDKNLL